jgi:hypothetical protein
MRIYDFCVSISGCGHVVQGFLGLDLVSVGGQCLSGCGPIVIRFRSIFFLKTEHLINR